MRFETLCLVCLLFLGSFLPRLVAATPAKSDPPVADRGQANRAEAARLLRRALGAEAAGRAADRTEFLNQARAAAPDYPPVRWHMGEVRLGNRWVPIREAASITNTDERVARYEALRATLRDTVNDHLKIARWCEHEGLVDQQRAHLLGALALQIDLEEAIVKLQAIQRRQAAAAEQQARALRIGPKQLARRSPWRSMVRKVEAGLDGDRPAQREPALRQLRAIRDPAAIPALEQLCDYDSAGAGGAVIAALSAMPEQAAADALVRLVLSSPDLQFSKLAASGLSSHSLFAYVPTFMSVLRPPALVKYEQFVVNDSIGHRLSIVDETPTAKHVTDSVGQPTGTFFIGPKRQFGAIYPDPTIERDRLQAAQALRVNQMRQFANERAILALQAATGKDVGKIRPNGGSGGPATTSSISRLSPRSKTSATWRRCRSSGFRPAFRPARSSGRRPAPAASSAFRSATVFSLKSPRPASWPISPSLDSPTARPARSSRSKPAARRSGPPAAIPSG